MKCNRSMLGGAIVALACCAIGHAQGSRSEIRALLDRLPASGCEFGRNGEWHAGDLARDHLAMKHGYMRMQNPKLSVEEFIANGASGSSSTSQPYRVRCKGLPEVPAAEWLNDQLRSMRAESGTK